MTAQIDPAAFQIVVADLQQRLQAAHADRQRAIHERDALQTRIEQRREKIWPVQVRCETRSCSSVVAFDPAPEEARLAEVLIALGWTADHRCPRCK